MRISRNQKRIFFAFVVLVLLVMLFLLVRTSQPSRMTTSAKLVVLPKAKFVPRKIPWGWAFPRSEKPQDFCAKAQNLREHLCTKGGQGWACDWLFDQAQEDSPQAKQWVDMLKRQCEQGDADGCMRVLAHTKDPTEKQAWTQTYNVILWKLCEQEDESYACEKLSADPKEDSSQKEQALAQYRMILQKRCQDDYEACRELYNSYEQTEDSLEKEHWYNQIAFVAQKPCLLEGNISACRAMYNQVKETPDYDQFVAALQNRCIQMNDAFACSYLAEEDSVDQKQWDDRAIAIWQRECEQDDDTVACWELSHDAASKHAPKKNIGMCFLRTRRSEIASTRSDVNGMHWMNCPRPRSFLL